MSRRALIAAVAALAACTSATAPTVTVGFRQPSAIALFHGFTRDDGGAALRPYLAVANAARNDLTILDAADDTSVQAPVQLRALVLPVAERPALLASASLGDGQADLLVAVSAGDSVLQVVTTWDDAPAIPVHTEPGTGSPAVDLADGVVAIVALPSDPGKARVAAALVGGKLAVVGWKRAADGTAIELDGAPLVGAPLGFEPVALAALPDDPDLAGVQTAIYAATPDALAPGVYGVAEISPDLATVRPLSARGPTRLVAAARLRERGDLSTAKDRSAFDFSAAPAPRVYAVLDEAGCGVEKKIPCGVVTLDPTKTLLDPADDYIPEDWSDRMPYRAPIAIPGRPLALAVSPPPVAPPSAEASDAGYAGDAMRVYGGTIPEATTAVGLVASDDGKVYFLDLGRFKAVTAASTLRALTVTVGTPAPVDTSTETTTTLRRRLWVQDAGGAFVPDLGTGVADVTAAAGQVGKTPGWTRTTDFTTSYQGLLPNLGARAAEAGPDGAGGVWLALQAGYGAPRRFAEVVKLWHPALGVQPGDVAVIQATGVPGCTGTPPPGATTTTPNEFELPIAALLPPGAAYPGGAVALAAPDEAQAEWTACWNALKAATEVVPRLTATVRAGGFVVTSAALGYVGRPTPTADALGWEYALAYPAEGEDALAAACPLVDWDGVSAPPLTACDATCRATCEAALLARKARRAHNDFEDCATDDTWTTECTAAFGTPTSPAFEGPAVAFRFGVQPIDAGVPAEPLRGLSLVVSTFGGEVPATPILTGSPYRASSAIAFDRSALTPATGYRFLVSYTGDLVLDTSPHVSPIDVVLVR